MKGPEQMGFWESLYVISIPLLMGLTLGWVIWG